MLGAENHRRVCARGSRSQKSEIWVSLRGSRGSRLSPPPAPLGYGHGAPTPASGILGPPTLSASPLCSV